MEILTVNKLVFFISFGNYLVTYNVQFERVASCTQPHKLLTLNCIYSKSRLITLLYVALGARAHKAIFKTDVVDLDSSNFDSVALDKTKDVLVEFYAPCKDILIHAFHDLTELP